ncbi:CHAT domain-containing protein [Hamadaea tsunoensis]|uniref:CHAT domain-containing protein n=1 Tax=Hamadaea tsunoensis TaxID=53368 RepID=UPI000429FCE6|nr:CHAT domain-containing protein [Hamadaea tsunoensis]
MTDPRQRAVSRDTDRRMALAREWDGLVEQVRRLDGFEDFLEPPPLATLREAAAEGPVVIVNVSRWRCDALVVTTAGVRSVRLPGLTAADVTTRTAAYLQALQDAAPAPDQSFSRRLETRAARRHAREQVLRATMEWLWDTVAQPVLADLGIGGPPAAGADPPRLWWCPTGKLTLLPLHGAGYHGAGDDRTVLDRAVSSYTPTLRALRESRRPSAPQPPRHPGLVFVGVPETLDQVQFAADAARERAAVTAAFPAGVTVLEGADATMAAVETALADHRWAHVSCHGYQDVYDPSRAGLMLADGTLTIPRINSGRRSGEFVFLAACMTATGGVNLPDESISLAAALNYAGYRHVIATLWRVHSVVAAQVTEAVYPQLCADGTFRPDRAPFALHDAVRTLRDSGARMSDWLPFTHNGP